MRAFGGKYHIENVENNGDDLPQSQSGSGRGRILVHFLHVNTEVVDQATQVSLNMAKVVFEVLPAQSVPAKTLAQMWRLFRGYYTNLDPIQSARDLLAKDLVILLRHSVSKRVVGFTTVEIYQREIDGQKIKVLYSGDTILHRKLWGHNLLHRPMATVIFKELLKSPTTPLYWFLISKGYKTYMLLARNFNEYWPRYDKETPANAKKLIDSLAADKFGDDYNPETGVLELGGRFGRLKQKVAPIDQSVQELPEAVFFEQQNPGHLYGDELCCLARLDLQSLGKAVRRSINLKVF